MSGDPLLSLDDMMSVYSGETGLEFEFVQLAPGHLGYGQTGVTIGDLTISSERVDKPLRVRLRTPPGFVSVSFLLNASGPAFWSGHEIETSHALVFGNEDHEYILPAGMRSLNVTAPDTAFERFGLPRPRSGLWRTAAVPRRLLTSVACAALAGRRFAPNCDERLLVAMCEALTGESGALRFKGNGQDHPTRQFRLLKQAERMDPEAATNIDALARGLGTSERSLHRAFKDLSGLGPQRYLRIVRLHQFRQRLAAADTHDTITRLAHDHGFEHTGRLASEYRDWFGELPRETLQRRRAT